MIHHDHIAIIHTQQIQPTCARLAAASVYIQPSTLVLIVYIKAQLYYLKMQLCMYGLRLRHLSKKGVLETKVPVF